MRRFKLINAVGAEYDLSSKQSFLQNPSGLGVSRSIDSISAGYDWIVTDNQVDQKPVSGEIVFLGYAKYTEFVRFCSYTPLTLCYAPLTKWYYRTCQIEQIDKTEINFGTKRLLCPVDFLCLGVWYDRTTIGKSELEPGAGKKYVYTYPYVYADTTIGSVAIDNTSLLDSPCILHMRGVAINPSWALIVRGVVQANGKVNANIPAGHKLVVNSSPSGMEIAEYTNDNVFVQNLYGDSDFGTQRFLLIPAGESTVTFSHEGTGELTAWVEVQQLATTV